MVGEVSMFSNDVDPSSATDETTAFPNDDRGDGSARLVNVWFHDKPLSSEYHHPDFLF
jgi:hypothetical protein